MTTEEKLKAYDCAIERARKLKEDPQSVFYEYSPKEGDTICDYIFPELRESEDEKIKKDIIVLVKDWWDRVNKDNISTKEQMIDWLENQTNKDKLIKELDEYKVKYTQEVLTQQLENRSKQTNIDKVNLKFNVGDWIVNNITKDVFLIKSINNGYYTLEDIKGNIISPCLPHSESESHIWTIQDAKDGDVLIDKSHVGECVFIFKEARPSDIKTDVNNPLAIIGYCGINHIGFTSQLSGLGFGDTVNCTYYPATKERRDTLFKKMKEAGYQWDDDKKELKKIVAPQPKFKVGDWVVQENIGVYKVIEVCESWYEVVDNQDKHYSIGFDKEYMCHLWTIQDAKDGDVLTNDNNSTFIFKEEYIAGKPTAYCGIIDGDFFAKTGGCWTNEKCYPATKEQHDLLFTKIEETGYQWDTEMKALKKIEYAITDNVKPKFKVNDWITDGEAIFHIIDYNIEHGYQLVTQNGTSFHFSDVNVENKYHLWTIQDAKDGDVLATKSYIYVFNNIDKETEIVAYYCLMVKSNGHFIFGDYGDYRIHDETLNSIPATKEQCDALFKSMKKAGYKWDANNKEVKKIEEDGVEYKKHITSELVNLAIASVKQKSEPTWSDQDEEILKNLIDYFSLDDGLRLPTDETIDWLKSIKSRVQPHSLTITNEELAQAKKNAYNDALDKIEYHSGGPTFDDGWCGAINYIRKKFIRPQNV